MHFLPLPGMKVARCYYHRYCYSPLPTDQWPLITPREDLGTQGIATLAPLAGPYPEAKPGIHPSVCMAWYKILNLGLPQAKKFYFFFPLVKRILFGVFMLGQSKHHQQGPSLNRFSFNMAMCTRTTGNWGNPQINVFNKLQVLLKMVCWDFKETVQ